ncbi:hypothetical protein JTE90_025694 [Oedothorax gibbosus]|uniref:Uncharacterized protein n=1 Tax=Oedothorax gibbosus TaxID=931172 RepID=A0AAV6TL67_9ARAC|nr:hypothetical protein JTE90_025694 [Oedothorax gibbosus]
MALSIPIDDGSKTDVLSDLTQAKPDVKIRVKRQPASAFQFHRRPQAAVLRQVRLQTAAIESSSVQS